MVTPPGRCHRGPLTNGLGRIPPYCVCSGAANTVTGGAFKPLRLGPSPASPVGPFHPAPPSRSVGCAGGFYRLSWLRFVGEGGVGFLAAPGRGACVRVPATPGWGLAASGGGWSLATPGWGSRVWLPATPGWGPPVSLGGWPVVTPGVPPLYLWLWVLGGRSLASPA